MSAADAAIQKKIYRSGTTALIISDKEMKDIMKIVESLEESELLAKQLKMTQNKKRRISFNVIRNISCQYIRKCISRKRSTKSR